MDDVISRRVAISLPVKPKEDRYFQTQNLDDAYDYGWSDLQRCIEKLPSAQPDYQEVLGWLLAYHTKSFDLHGRYMAHEVIGWLVHDFANAYMAESRGK